MEKMKKFFSPKAIFAVLLLIVMLLIPARASRLVQSILCMCCTYAALGLSWNVLSGLCGLFSVTHGIFFGIGTYAMLCCITKFGLHPLVGFVVGLLINLLLALLVGKIGSKLSSLYFTMALIGVSNALYTLAVQMNWLTNSTYGISMGRKYSITRLEACYVGIVMVVVFALFFVFLRKSRMGTSLVALKNNPNLCMALGSNVEKWRLYATIIAAMMASLVGVYYAFYMKTATPDLFTGVISLKILTVCICGGIGNVWGPILGSTIIILDEYVKGVMPSELAPISYVVYALVMITMLMLKPEGLVSIKLPKLGKKAQQPAAPKA